MTTTNYTSSELPDTNYYWRVRAWDGAGNSSDFENAWNFLIDTTAPEKPSLLGPDNVVENAAVFQFTWNPVDDLAGVTYHLKIDRENTFSPPFYHEKENIGKNYYIFDQALTTDNFQYWHVDDYRWRVRAVDRLGHKGEWSNPLLVTLNLRDFTLSIDPTKDEIGRKHYGLVEITATRLGGHDEIIGLSCSGQPPGVRVFFDAIGAKPPFEQSMTIAVEEEAPLGDHTLTIRARIPTTTNIRLTTR